MRRHLVLCLVAASSGCGGSHDYAGAAITAGMAVAAAGVYRTATDGCWADCGPGFECDEPSGACVPTPCHAKCHADYRCMWVDGQQKCVLPAREGVGQLEPVEGGRKSDRADNNKWLCLAAGVTDCADRPHSLPADPDDTDRSDVDVITGSAGEDP
jgi:hypothetical protein